MGVIRFLIKFTLKQTIFIKIKFKYEIYLLLKIEIQVKKHRRELGVGGGVKGLEKKENLITKYRK